MSGMARLAKKNGANEQSGMIVFLALSQLSRVAIIGGNIIYPMPGAARAGRDRLSDSLIVDGLASLAASLDGLPLIAGKNTPGAFPPTKAGKEAAARCLSESLVRTLSARHEGRSGIERFTLSERGLDWLRQQASAKDVLERIGDALSKKEAGLEGLTAQLSRQLEQLQAIKSLVLELADRAGKQTSTIDPATVEDATLLAELQNWGRQHPLKDYDLPSLYHALRPLIGFSVGRFHDACRRLAEQRRVYLHPWTGPLYQMPEPTLAFLWGHEIAYYASLRETAEESAADAMPRGYMTTVG